MEKVDCNGLPLPFRTEQGYVLYEHDLHGIVEYKKEDYAQLVAYPGMPLGFQPVTPVNGVLADWLLANREHIPESWYGLGGEVVFKGTRYKKNGQMYLRAWFLGLAKILERSVPVNEQLVYVSRQIVMK